MNKDNRQNRIDDYLLGRAGQEDRLEFEEEVTRNAELSNELAETELAMAAIELAEDRALKARLQKLESNLSATAPDTATVAATPERKAKVVTMKSRRSGSMKLLAYAAALLLVLAVGWWALTTSSGFEPELLAMESFEPYQNITTGTVRGDSGMAAEAAAFADYDAGNFADAEVKLAALATSNVNKFYLGQTLLAQKKFAEASAVFVPLAQISDFPLAKEANYYNALAFLGQAKVSDARHALTQIARDNEHPMQQEAEKLLAKM
ncbi:MAG: tol-pal system YbgF family protein [Lewinella sp.]